MILTFKGAEARTRDDGAREYVPRDLICIESTHIVGFYDHTILTPGHKIRVMESLKEIRRKVEQ